MTLHLLPSGRSLLVPVTPLTQLVAELLEPSLLRVDTLLLALTRRCAGVHLHGEVTTSWRAVSLADAIASAELVEGVAVAYVDAQVVSGAGRHLRGAAAPLLLDARELAGWTAVHTTLLAALVAHCTHVWAEGLVVLCESPGRRLRDIEREVLDAHVACGRRALLAAGVSGAVLSAIERGDERALRTYLAHR